MEIEQILVKEEAETRGSRQIIEAAIDAAIARGVHVAPGAVFNWNSTSELPKACNALGAVLLACNKAHLASAEGFDPDWLDELSKVVKADRSWLWRFCCGFDYGNELVLSQAKDSGKTCGASDDVSTREKVSAYGAKLARKYRS